MKSKFIVYEGIDGCGKSTNIKQVKKHLEDSYGVKVHVVREPGGTPVAETLRSIAKGENIAEKIEDTTELLLMFAARSQLIANEIKPALARGEWVISDRFTSSTLAYQGYGRGISLDDINLLKNIVQGDFAPDITFILDIDVETSMKRACRRGELDRIESSGKLFFEKVRFGYLKEASLDPFNNVVINAEDNIESVVNKSISSLNSWINALNKVN